MRSIRSFLMVSCSRLPSGAWPPAAPWMWGPEEEELVSEKQGIDDGPGGTPKRRRQPLRSHR